MQFRVHSELIDTLSPVLQYLFQVFPINFHKSLNLPNIMFYDCDIVIGDVYFRKFFFLEFLFCDLDFFQSFLFYLCGFWDCLLQQRMKACAPSKWERKAELLS